MCFNIDISQRRLFQNGSSEAVREYKDLNLTWQINEFSLFSTEKKKFSFKIEYFIFCLCKLKKNHYDILLKNVNSN